MKLLPLFSLVLLAPLVAASAPRPLLVDIAHSKVEIAVKTSVDSFHGQLERYTAEVAIDPNDNQATSAKFSFDFLDLKTGNKSRDEEMHKWQDTPKNPAGIFTLERIEIGADKARKAHGTLTLHGVSKPIDFPVSIASDQGLYSIDGEAIVNTTDFLLPVIRKFLVLKVDPKVAIRFHLQGRLAD